MGSFGDYKKGRGPIQDRVRKHNNEYHDAIGRRNAAMPWRLRLLRWLGFPGPSYRWETREDLGKYWPEDGWISEAEHEPI